MDVIHHAVDVASDYPTHNASDGNSRLGATISGRSNKRLPDILILTIEQTFKNYLSGNAIEVGNDHLPLTTFLSQFLDQLHTRRSILPPSSTYKSR